MLYFTFCLQEVDIGAVDLSVHYGRSLYVDYVFPSFMVETTDIIYRRQGSSDESFFLLLRPLRPDVYIVFLSLCLGTIILFFFFEHFRYLKSKAKHPVKISTVCWELSAVGWEFIGTIVKQG